MKTLKIDTAFLENTKELSDVEFGRLFRGMLKYAFSDADVKLGGNERFFWSGVKADIDKQLKAYSARAANISKARDNNPNNNANLLNNKNGLLNNSEQQKEDEESGKEGEKKSSPLKPPVKENTQEKGKEGEEKHSSRAKKAFIPPTLDEVRAYVAERHSSVDPVQFWEYFDAGHWIDSEGKPVHAWKQKLLTWEKFDGKKGDGRGQGRNTEHDQKKRFNIKYDA
jgi:hypothetical protein